MSVVQITKACTLSCTYCFDKVGQSEAKSKSAKVTIDRNTFWKYLSRMWEFFQANPKDKNICISGWEPTLHPLFKQFVNSSIHSGFQIYLLSNLTFSTEIAEFLKPLLNSEKLTIMTNINSPYADYAKMNKALWTRTLINLKILEGPGVRLSFNIFDPDLDYEFIFEVLSKYPKLDKTVRLWVVNPIIKDLRRDWTYVFDDKKIIEGKKETMWSMYKRLWKVVDKLVERLTNLWYSIYLDCGVGWCIFNSKTLQLIKNNKGITHKCSLPNDEVSTDGQYSSCYTLYDYGNEDRILNVNTLSIKKSRWYFILKTEFFKEHNLILPKCKKCPLLEKWCPRFCVSNNLYYYESLYKDWILDDTKIIEDKFYSKLTLNEKLFTKIEYGLSRNLLEDTGILIRQLKGYKDIVEWKYNENNTIRPYIYYVLHSYLTWIFDKKRSLEYISNLMTQVTNKNSILSSLDFKLVKVVEILIKEYKKK